MRELAKDLLRGTWSITRFGGADRVSHATAARARVKPGPTSSLAMSTTGCWKALRLKDSRAVLE